MNTSETNRDNSNDGRTSDENLCLLYLFGELDADAKSRFERQLASDPKLCETLAEQSYLITAAAVATDDQLAQSTAVQQGATLWTAAAWRSIAALSAVAACIALVIQVVDYSARPADRLALNDATLLSESELDESVLIAKAWAQSSTESASMDTSMIDDVEPLEDLLDEQPSDLDATLDWIFVAMASRDETQTEDGNDG
jgi:anti-sigma factor RsiW